MMKRMSNNDFRTLIVKARKRNRDRDAIDRAYGRATPSDCPLDSFLVTVLSAMETGIVMNNQECLAEAYEMIEAYVKSLHPHWALKE
jgi:hypothetical protein